MAPLTELLILQLQDPSETLDGSGEAATTWKDSLILLVTQGGATRVHWGKVIEHPTWIRAFIEWESSEKQDSFRSSNKFTVFSNNVMKVFSDKFLVAHSHLTNIYGTAHKAFTSPATELLSIFVPADYTAAKTEKFEADMRQFINNVTATPQEKNLRAAAGGWVVEDMPPDTTWPSTNRKTWFFCIGWDCVQDHIDFRSYPVFKENIHLIRGADEFQDLLNMHMNSREVVGK